MIRPMFEHLLAGGDRRSLQGVDDAVDLVLADAGLFGELFGCLFSGDAIVRMRASDAVEKVSRERADLLAPYVDRLLHEVATIDQPSVQWHLAQILSRVDLMPAQRDQALALLWRNLEDYDDLLVKNLTLEALADFAVDDAAVRERLLPVLRTYTTSERKSLAARARRLLASI
jgi:hypothetical protein